MKKKAGGSGKKPAGGLARMKIGVKQMEDGLKSLKTASKEPKGTGLSLHIGVNKLDPKCYPIDPDDLEGSGWDGPLSACERDARDMKKIADSQGFNSTMLLTSKATAASVVKEMRKAARTLSAGDIFFLTYSGHGGQVDDTSGDEIEDNADETWCLFDRQLIDDELYALYSEFKAGVRVLVLSDSCHSGTVSRAVARFEPALTAKENKEIFGTEKPVFRVMPRQTSMMVYYAREEFYNDIQRNVKQVQPEDVKASIRLISACQDNEEAADGMRNGKFTSVVRKVWADGSFKGGCEQFHAAIKKDLEMEYARVLKHRKKGTSDDLTIQIPNYNAEGAEDAEFDKHQPFSI